MTRASRSQSTTTHSLTGHATCDTRHPSMWWTAPSTNARPVQPLSATTDRPRWLNRTALTTKLPRRLISKLNFSKKKLLKRKTKNKSFHVTELNFGADDKVMRHAMNKVLLSDLH